MKLKSILSLVGLMLFYNWLWPACPTPEAWLRKTCEVEREKWLGKTWGNGALRCDRIMEGPGKLVTYEYSTIYPSSGFPPDLEPRFKSAMEADPRYEAIMGQYRSRGIVVEVNLYSSDKKMLAGLKL